MIYVDCIDFDDDKESYILIEIHVNYDDPTLKDKIIEDEFEEKILKSIERDKRVIFSINQLDNDGFILLILKFWREKSGRNIISIKTDNGQVKNVFQLALEDGVEFL